MSDNTSASQLCTDCAPRSDDPELEAWKERFLEDNYENYGVHALQGANFDLHTMKKHIGKVGETVSGGISRLHRHITGKKESTVPENTIKTSETSSAESSDASDQSDSSESESESDADTVNPEAVDQKTVETKDVPDDSCDDGSCDDDVTSEAGDTADAKKADAVGDKSSRTKVEATNKEEGSGDSSEESSEDDSDDVVEEGAGIGTFIGNGLKRGASAVGTGVSGVGSMLYRVPDALGSMTMMALSAAGEEPTFDEKSATDDSSATDDESASDDESTTDESATDDESAMDDRMIEGAGLGKSISKGLRRGAGAIGSGLSGMGSILSEVPNHIGTGIFALASGGEEPVFDTPARATDDESATDESTTDESATDDESAMDDRMIEGAGLGKSIGKGLRRGAGAIGSGLSGMGSILSEVPNHIGTGIFALASGGGEPVFNNTRARSLMIDRYGPGQPSAMSFVDNNEILTKRRAIHLRHEYEAARAQVALRAKNAASHHMYDNMYTRPYDRARYTGRYDPMVYTGAHTQTRYTGQDNPAKYSGAYNARSYAAAYNDRHSAKLLQPPRSVVR